MEDKDIKGRILFEEHKILENNDGEELDKLTKAYLNACLLTRFGIELTNPEKISKKAVEDLANWMHLTVPRSFYSNPQDLKHFTSEELGIEQLISYMVIELTGNGTCDNEHPEKYDRIEIFKKVLPQYVQGDELKLRKFTIVDEKEAEITLKEVMKSYCAYKRPFGIEECVRFDWLMGSGYYEGWDILCKDNIISCAKRIFNTVGRANQNVVDLVSKLDAKDVVKYSKATYGEFKELPKEINKDFFLGIMLFYCQDLTNISKKQAKGFNALLKAFGYSRKKLSAENNADKIAKEALNKGDVIKAAEIYLKNGSMFERNLIFLLSRANFMEKAQIINMLPAKNPYALMQLIKKIDNDDTEKRTFTFYKNNRVTKHIESDFEQTWRKSRLNSNDKVIIKNELLNKIREYYKKSNKIQNKFYVSEEFKKIAMPINTSASGSGLDVLPVGSRMPIKYDNIRIFCHWKNAYDIDTNCILINENGKVETYSWRIYGRKYYDNDLLCSGDCRDKNGAEYTDIVLSGMKNRGFKYIVYTMNAYPNNVTFDDGEIYTGYQNKKDLNTTAWDPKNIEVQIQVKGNSKSYIGFAIDLETNELIILNLLENSMNSCVDSISINTIKEYLEPLNFSIFDVITANGSKVEITRTPEEADIVFDSEYVGKEDQTVIRPWDIKSLIELCN